MKKVVVTGGSGRLGTWTVREFLEHGYDVVNADVNLPERPACRTVKVDLAHLGEVYGVLAGADAVVHLAAIPVAYSHPNEVVFRNNVMSTYNVLEAAAGLGIRKVVIASSESSYGIIFAVRPFAPLYVPVDEEHPQLPQDSYGLSKVVRESPFSGVMATVCRFPTVLIPVLRTGAPCEIQRRIITTSARGVAVRRFLGPEPAAFIIYLEMRRGVPAPVRSTGGERRPFPRFLL